MSVRTTYFSALANGDVSIAPDDDVFGVVRRPADWLFEHDVVDRNIPAVAPPEELLDAFKRVESAAEDDDDVAEPTRLAWETVNFERRYLDYLEAAGPQQVLDTLRERADKRCVWLACWEADDTYCHRRLLAARLRDEILTHDRPHVDDACPSGEHDVVPDPRSPHTRICAECRLSTQTLVDYLGHDLGGA